MSMSAMKAAVERAELRDGVVRMPLQLSPLPQERRFVCDIYAMESNEHPRFHMGWWAWPTPVAMQARELQLVYHSASDVVVHLIDAEGALHAPEMLWLNPDFKLSPLQQISLLWYDTQDQPRCHAQVAMAVLDDQLLQAYYADNSQRYVVVHPLIQAFHERRLAVLRRLFRQYIAPGSQVLDVGSGHSMFYLINGERWPFRITCLDLDRTLLRQIAPQRPSYNWLISGGQHLPFADASFDVLYAGEVIEHVPDANATLAEWYRVLRPGGTLIVTTPNRLRLLNRVNNTSVPVSPEHLIEFTCDDLDAMFAHNQFTVIYREGIYLELLALWRQRPPYVDPLAVGSPLPRHLLALKPLMLLARPVPQYAFNLVYVGRKV